VAFEVQLSISLPTECVSALRHTGHKDDLQELVKRLSELHQQSLKKEPDRKRYRPVEQAPPPPDWTAARHAPLMCPARTRTPKSTRGIGENRLADKGSSAKMFRLDNDHVSYEQDRAIW